MKLSEMDITDKHELSNPHEKDTPQLRKMGKEHK